MQGLLQHLRALGCRWAASLHAQVLAAFLPILTLQHFLDQWGYPVVLVFVLIESTGIPFPGETMLLLGAFFAASGHLSIYGVIASAAAGAIMGDNFGYWVGRKGGRPLVRRYGNYVFVKEKQLSQAERYFERHGDKTVFFGRFLSILRTWAAFLAGVNRMRWPTFLFYNAAGGIVWAIIYGIIGYFIGRAVGVDTIERYSSEVGYAAIAIVVIVVVVLILRRVLRRRHERREEVADSHQEQRQEAGQQPENEHEREKLPHA
jgi:membrane protein DedA with SNARE-associated domain